MSNIVTNTCVDMQLNSGTAINGYPFESFKIGHLTTLSIDSDKSSF